MRAKSSYYLEQYHCNEGTPAVERPRQWSSYLCSKAKTVCRPALAAKLDREIRLHAMLTCELMMKCEMLVILKYYKGGKGISMWTGGTNIPVYVLLNEFCCCK
ncbi:hypothetical protein HAX54_036847, partial [Datura stramonium]|nr:hypothetical protein [Datura stramonium]